MAPLQAARSGLLLPLLALIALSSLKPTLAVRLSSNICATNNYEYKLNLLPASGWYFRGSGNDDFCNANPLLKQYLCNVAASPYCTDETKSETCAAASSPSACNAASRVFSVIIDSDCDFVVFCEYRSSITPVSTSSPPALTPSAPLATLPVGTLPVATPQPLLVSLAPKPGDVVVLSAFALGSAEYTCNASNALFDNGTLSATLYSVANGAVLGNLSNVVSLQGQRLSIFDLSNGSVTIDMSTSRTFPSPTSIPRDGGYGSLMQTYSSATGTGAFATVRFATTSDISGGMLPPNAPCPVFAFPTQTLRPWSVPYQATYNFFSAYTLP
ncbi:hypothetical protein KFL_004090110 [Klebsormidium nitens]|uniref:Uncharacterized protein n=1 Tax=Klebsormidium nitens TaxID=105231 RepID=A0A1Y1IFF8_KLENI|nr:hypothetical protein KFL_004090110 [Klebsormidium nitens]|eukprot:GAQ88209.1 hypothetical protein KFL_004090110 [Klebsormidium nitens]